MLAIAVALALSAGAAGIWIVTTLPEVTALRTSRPASTAFIELRRAEARAAGRPFHLTWQWRRVEQISPYLRAAVIEAEDARFYRHGGIDWAAARGAARRDWEERRLAAGASTITQQLAKNLYLSPSRDPLRKLRELLLARRLERTLSKRRILELYLNVAEWGDGVFGAEAAARVYFGRSAAALSPVQAARLAVALPNPRRRSPAIDSPGLDRKAARLVEAMVAAGLVDRAAWARARVELGVDGALRHP